MKVGTKSVVFGVHAILVHPFFGCLGVVQVVRHPLGAQAMGCLPRPRCGLHRRSHYREL